MPGLTESPAANPLRFAAGPVWLERAAGKRWKRGGALMIRKENGLERFGG